MPDKFLAANVQQALDCLWFFSESIIFFFLTKETAENG